MKNKQNAIIRLTINVNMNNTAEIAIMRAMLRRLNVLHADCKDHGAIKTILGAFKLRDAYEQTAEKSPEFRAKLAAAATSAPSNVIALPPPQNAAAETIAAQKPPVSVTPVRFDLPNFRMRITRIFERKMPLPIDVVKHS